MYDMRTREHDDDRDNYRRDDYRRDYRYDYTDDNRRDYRHGRRMGRNYRNYREEEDFIEELEECVDEGMYKYRKYEDLAEMTDDRNEKNTLLKIAEREKEHYKALKEILEKHM